jgi:FKBP-type peptidyl-prolyl cis-trans isomerase FkpA
MFVRLLRRPLPLLACSVIAAAAAACGDNSPTSPSATTVTRTDLRVGSGDEAATGKTLTVNYTGWLFDASKPEQKGLLIDTSLGRDAFAFTLGAGQVIPGWDEGLPGMKVGGLRRLVIPPTFGYGNTRNGPIPANSTLVFEIDLVKVE